MLEKKLKLYRTSANNLNIKERFPTTAEGELPLEIGEFTYDAKRMGGAPTIQCTIMYQRCLDDEWTDYVYTDFRGERYYLKQTPSSSKDNKSAMWKHECEFISERRVLDNVYFFDIVKADEGGNKPVSNSTDFTFFGDIFEFATRLTESMKYAGVDYVVDAEKHRTELTDATVGKQVTFQDKFISEALQEIFNVYGYHYYFEGKTIYIGDSNDYEIGSDKNPLEYGGTKELLSIQKNNANYKPINKITSRGSDQNIPYYYPNPHRKGEVRPIITEWGGIGVEIDDEDTFYIKLDSWDKMIGADKSESIAIVRFEGVYMQRGAFDIGQEYLMYEYDFNESTSLKMLNFLPYVALQPLGLGEMGIIVKYVYDFNDNSATRKIRAYTPSALDNIQITVENASISYSTESTPLSCYGKFYRIENGNRSIIGETTGLGKEIIVDAKIAATYEWYVMYNFRHIIASTTDIKKGDFKTYSGRLNIKPSIMLRDGIATNIYKDEKIVDTIITLDDITEKPYKEYGIKLTAPNIGIGKDVVISQEFVRYWKPQKNLMPKVYINSGDTERFYTAKNYPIRRGASIIIPNENIGEYKNTENGNIENDNYKADNGAYYQFENPYVANNPYEHIIDFEDIMPTIESVENSDGLRIDMFSEFAYDDGDNNKETKDRKDNKDESGELRREHPYFFGKLRTMPFNLFDHAIEGGEMTIAMTSGSLGSCKFVIHVGEEHQKNIVQVNSDGSLKRDEYGNVVCGRRIYVEGKGWKEQGKQQPQDVQNDTRTNEVWVALAKDVETFPSVMPYAPDGELSPYRPSASEKDSEGKNDLNNGDTFVILNIKLPQAYIDKAEEKLTKETIKYLAENNSEKFTFSIDFSKVYLAMNPNVLNSLNENSSVYIKYNDKVYKQFISSYSYKMSSKDTLPEIKVELSETLSTQKGALQQVINAVKSEVQYSIGASGGSGFRLGDLDRQYIRKDTQDKATGNITFLNGTKYGKGKEDGKTSAEMQIDDENNSTLTVDNLIVRNNDERVQELIERIVSLENKINELTNN